jgi:hypothetical protein
LCQVILKDSREPRAARAEQVGVSEGEYALVDLTEREVEEKQL